MLIVEMLAPSTLDVYCFQPKSLWGCALLTAVGVGPPGGCGSYSGRHAAWTQRAWGGGSHCEAPGGRTRVLMMDTDVADVTDVGTVSPIALGVKGWRVR